MLRDITSRDNPHYRALVRLQRAGGASRRDALAVIEGEHLVEVCLAQALDRLRGVYVRETAPPLCGLPSSLPCWRLPASLFDRASQLPAPPNILAVIEIPPSGEAGRCGFVLALDRVQDPGNVGTLIRTAAAAGCSEVWVDRGSATAWSSKTLRAAQGAHFQVPVHDGVDLAEALACFEGERWATLPAGQGGASVSLDALATASGHAGAGTNRVVIVSNEGAGLSPGLMPLVDHALVIPMARGVESLNVAVAGAIALYALRPTRVTA